MLHPAMAGKIESGFGCQNFLQEGTPEMENNGLWVWGYVLDQVPGQVPFVPFESWCSLETACSYLRADNAVYMNSCSSMEALDDALFSRMANCKNVVCGLDHADYQTCAEKVSLFSLKHPNISGAIIDDFLDEVGDYYQGPSARMTPEKLRDIRHALKKHNPDLKLYVVRYTRQDPERLLPYLDHFDVLNLWVWSSTRDFWQAQYLDTIANLRAMYRKPILQGIFLHHYGFCPAEQPPMDPELLQIQCERVSEELRCGRISGWCFLQNGWFSLQSHRKILQDLKGYLEWFYGTTTAFHTLD